jgi:voltage-gated potassium channel
MFNFFRVTKIYRPIFLIVGVISVGTIGFVYIENYRVLDAIYMTVITIGTVGFSEVHPLSDMGRIFTSVLILTTLGIFAYSVTLISHSFVEGDARRYFLRKYLRRKIKKMKNHVIICGLGRTGRSACYQLMSSDTDIVIIDRKGERKNPKLENLVIVAGDATDEKSLIEAGIMHARAIICTLPSDADNVFVILTAKGLNPNIRVISRASQENSYDKMLRAGADAVIRPEEIGGNLMANLVVKPDISAFWRLLSYSDGASESYREIPCFIFPKEALGKPIHDLHIRRATGVSIIGYKTAAGEILINPFLDIPLEQKGKLFVLGTKAQFDTFYEVFAKKEKRV